MQKTFLLGVGCQKGGTTWLHDYLDAHPNTDMGFLKEYHIFDALHIDECRVFQERAVNRARRIFQKNGKVSQSQPSILKKLDFYRDTRNYFDYFHYLSLKSDQTHLVGDITPSYAALPATVFESIREDIVKRGLQPRVVFLMRDPFERVWSHLRMHRRDRIARSPDKPLAQSEQDHLKEFYTTSRCEIRTRYEVTVKNLDKVFGQDNVFIGFYENLFEEDTLRKLMSFLELDYLAADFDKKINVSDKSDSLDTRVVKQVVQHYGQTYDYAMDRFGEEFIRNIWPGARYIGQ